MKTKYLSTVYKVKYITGVLLPVKMMMGSICLLS